MSGCTWSTPKPQDGTKFLPGVIKVLIYVEGTPDCLLIWLDSKGGSLPSMFKCQSFTWQPVLVCAIEKAILLDRGILYCIIFRPCWQIYGTLLLLGVDFQGFCLFVLVLVFHLWVCFCFGVFCKEILCCTQKLHINFKIIVAIKSCLALSLQ